ncbi:MAG: rRNA maturation RNase YbeY [Phycisphaerales bacterium]|jgi:probable rRNA maturation factor|nr:rRNA maturation RNase YbeY [Phycisphaerales bacterium]MBT7170969.1 rRNA maturation RNase YbeY [Phycisphaerales bacterium]
MAMNDSISITTRCRSLRTPRKRALALVEFVAHRETQRIGALDILVVDSPEMAEMNQAYLQHSGTTDVISFELSEPGEPIVGQLILCGEVARKAGPTFGNRPQTELLLYLTHGLLHLMGYDDLSKPERSIMHQRQQELLDAFLAGDGK